MDCENQSPRSRKLEKCIAPNPLGELKAAADALPGGHYQQEQVVVGKDLVDLEDVDQLGQVGDVKLAL